MRISLPATAPISGPQKMDMDVDRLAKGRIDQDFGPTHEAGCVYGGATGCVISAARTETFAFSTKLILTV